MIKKRWDKAVSLEMVELEEGLGHFKVVDNSVHRDHHKKAAGNHDEAFTF